MRKYILEAAENVSISRVSTRMFTKIETFFDIRYEHLIKIDELVILK